jgi:carbon-monoxide dehydrogenase medium subunit
MKPAPFDYVRAESIDHAVAELARAEGEGVLLAGGQTLMPLLALRMAQPALVIDINRIDGLAGVTKVAGATRIGATTRQNTVLADPLVARHIPALASAVRNVGHHQTRNRGTLGGSVSLGEPAAEMPAVTVALDAVIHVQSPEGSRTIDALDFYSGPYMNALLHDEMVVAVEYPDWPEDSITVVHEIGRRPGDFALVGLVCQVAISAGKVSRAGIAWFGMGPTPMRAHQAEKALLGAAVGEIDPRAIAELAVADTDPFDDAHATRTYRQTVGRRIFSRLLGDALNAQPNTRIPA